MNIRNLFTYIILLFTTSLISQDFLHTEGQDIIDINGDPIILRGYGLGGWMLMEGYMMLSTDGGNTQHEYKEQMVNLVGQGNMEAFYEEWLNTYCTKADIDSLKAWGFNSVRLPMHYDLYTLPIELEAPNQNTWLDKGFELTDALLEWCEENELYLILDLHAAPGGQGYDEAISDYDPSKPSLWESSANQAKMVALWGQLAERYADEPWMGGYDLLNEVNWDLPGGTALRSLYVQATNAIREHDTNHIIFIEGNWFANDFTGLTPPWDDNIVYSFHKYWSINDQNSIQWVLDLREQQNVPLWCGETGENSATWFRENVELLESHNIGWAWWPMKKMSSISGPLSIRIPSGYQNILDYWAGNGPAPTAATAQNTFLQLAENAKIENCDFQKEVVDALIRQPHSDESIPFKDHEIPGLIFMTDFDLGRDGVAYNDAVVANYHLSTGQFTAWNTGWRYRNDGVDIDFAFDISANNGTAVGWTEAGEWMKYTVNVTETGYYNLNVRTAAQGGGGALQLLVNDVVATPKIFLPNTGNWSSFQTTAYEEVYLEAGEQELKVLIANQGSNLNYFQLLGPNAASSNSPFITAAATNVEGSTIQMDFQKPLDVATIPTGDFIVKINNTPVNVTNVYPNPFSTQSVFLDVETLIVYGDIVTVSYNTSGVNSIEGIPMDVFVDYPVVNNLPEPDFYHPIPGKIEVEDFHVNEGFEFEECSDVGGGLNAGFTNTGDYLDFLVDVSVSGTYDVFYRVAADAQPGSLSLQKVNPDGTTTPLDLVIVPNTGGWQTWITVPSFAPISLSQGQQVLRLRANSDQYNINWIEFDVVTPTKEAELVNLDVQIYPNPATGNNFYLGFNQNFVDQDIKVSIIDNLGKTLKTNTLENNNLSTYHWNELNLPNGMYFIKVEVDGFTKIVKWLKI